VAALRKRPQPARALQRLVSSGFQIIAVLAHRASAPALHMPSVPLAHRPPTKRTDKPMTINRRQLLSSVSIGTLALMTTNAFGQDAPISPMEWTDKNGLVKDLAKDTDPLKDELTKYPRCRYCGMMRAKFSHTRMLIVYENDAVDATCSLHCSAIGLALNMDLGPKAMYVGDAGAEGDIKPLIDAGKAHYVIDPSKPGTMTKVSKAAFSSAAQAEAAAKAEASAKAGAKVADFDTVLKDAYLGMAEDTIMVRKRRSEMRMKNG
jgi:nitrous oxide reductase accessory protein NosL